VKHAQGINTSSFATTIQLHSIMLHTRTRITVQQWNDDSKHSVHMYRTSSSCWPDIQQCFTIRLRPKF